MTRAYQLCRFCGHARCRHEHLRRGSDCSCGCLAFRRRPLLARIIQALSGGKETSPA